MAFCTTCWWTSTGQEVDKHWLVEDSLPPTPPASVIYSAMDSSSSSSSEMAVAQSPMEVVNSSFSQGTPTVSAVNQSNVEQQRTACKGSTHSASVRGLMPATDLERSLSTLQCAAQAEEHRNAASAAKGGIC